MNTIIEPPLADRARARHDACCYHCGKPVPPAARHSAVIDGHERPTCCAECAALAQTLAENGRQARYRKRCDVPQRERTAAVALEELEVYAARERRTTPWRLFVAGSGMLPAMMYAAPAYIAGGDMSPEVEQLMRWASLIFTTPVVLWSAGPFFANAWRDLKARRAGTDLPVALGIGIAFIASAFATLRGAGEVYFGSVATFVFLLLGARYLEMTVRAKAGDRVFVMDRAQAERPRIALLADRGAQWFVAGLLAVAGVTALVWYGIEPQRALWVLVAVLVVACPYALSPATPAALTAATGALYRQGILVTRGHALETLARATHVVFDKTGMLTSGRMSLIGVIPVGVRSAEACLAAAAALERGSEHPLARALVAVAPQTATPAACDLRNYPGQGVEARLNGRLMRIGAPLFVAGLPQRPLPQELVFTADDVTVVALGDEQGFLALFTFGDVARAGARRLVRELSARGLAVCLLSGDRRETVECFARDLGIATAQGEASPEEKLEFVRALQAQGATVAMVGDGVNDAPVLAQAQVSIAMGGGTGLAHASADMVLLPDDLERLLDAVNTAQKTRRVIRQNLAWAVVYNAVALPLAVLGLVTPLVAGASMALCSLAVVANALRLTRAVGRRPASIPSHPVPRPGLYKAV